MHPNNNKGIEIHFSNENVIHGNVIDKFRGICPHQHMIGIDLQNTSNNTIEANTISNSTEKGIFLIDSNDNSIINNNFLNNYRNALFINGRNKWQFNFWDRPRLLYPIFGKMTLGKFTIPWVNLDWHPAREPYDIYQ